MTSEILYPVIYGSRDRDPQTSTVLSSENLAEERDEGLYVPKGARIGDSTETADLSLWELMDTRPFWRANDTFTGVANQTFTLHFTIVSKLQL